MGGWGGGWRVGVEQFDGLGTNVLPLTACFLQFVFVSLM